MRVELEGMQEGRGTKLDSDSRSYETFFIQSFYIFSRDNDKEK